MTDTKPHRATPEQWADVESWAAEGMRGYANIVELRARIEKLEGSYETMRLAALEWGKDVDKLMRWSDQHLQRIEALGAGATCPHIRSSDEGTGYCGLAEQMATATPPPELVQKGGNEKGGIYAKHIALRAAQWGADQELEACCRELAEYCDCGVELTSGSARELLMELRRPKPPSLAEEALKELIWVDRHLDMPLHTHCTAIHTIRRALERLQQLEDQQ
jgi:hypothetical protein